MLVIKNVHFSLDKAVYNGGDHFIYHCLSERIKYRIGGGEVGKREPVDNDRQVDYLKVV